MVGSADWIDGKYLLPNDEREQRRLDSQHDFLFDGNSLHKAPLQGLLNVLDVGTGTGKWAMAVADTYPDAEVTAVDISPNLMPIWPPTNCKFLVDDAEHIGGIGNKDKSTKTKDSFYISATPRQKVREVPLKGKIRDEATALQYAQELRYVAEELHTQQVYMFDLCAAIMSATKGGDRNKFYAENDGIHLSEFGNSLLADGVLETLRTARMGA
ncbi:hypothetical protein O1611_g6445 [Lasiodiplodia mahajangana]|uniref:Uncharacterized protein n=1 Tax=Lasiodiplodia mahajangana TaxID=1108764 RepID=A0ACC2JJ29_9PEZI|nr:hypothetical protein O1611_g6445 [Lasiodiplodia mahajangana]